MTTELFTDSEGNNIFYNPLKQFSTYSYYFVIVASQSTDGVLKSFFGKGGENPILNFTKDDFDRAKKRVKWLMETTARSEVGMGSSAPGPGEGTSNRRYAKYAWSPSGQGMWVDSSGSNNFQSGNNHILLYNGATDADLIVKDLTLDTMFSPSSAPGIDDETSEMSPGYYSSINIQASMQLWEPYGITFLSVIKYIQENLFGSNGHDLTYTIFPVFVGEKPSDPLTSISSVSEIEEIICNPLICTINKIEANSVNAGGTTYDINFIMKVDGVGQSKAVSTIPYDIWINYQTISKSSKSNTPFMEAAMWALEQEINLKYMCYYNYVVEYLKLTNESAYRDLVGDDGEFKIKPLKFEIGFDKTWENALSNVSDILISAIGNIIPGGGARFRQGTLDLQTAPTNRSTPGATATGSRAYQNGLKYGRITAITYQAVDELGSLVANSKEFVAGIFSDGEEEEQGTGKNIVDVDNKEVVYFTDYGDPPSYDTDIAMENDGRSIDYPSTFRFPIYDANDVDKSNVKGTLNTSSDRSTFRNDLTGLTIVKGTKIESAIHQVLASSIFFHLLLDGFVITETGNNVAEGAPLADFLAYLKTGRFKLSDGLKNTTILTDSLSILKYRPTIRTHMRDEKLTYVIGLQGLPSPLAGGTVIANANKAFTELGDIKENIKKAMDRVKKGDKTDQYEANIQQWQGIIDKYTVVDTRSRGSQYQRAMTRDDLLHLEYIYTGKNVDIIELDFKLNKLGIAYFEIVDFRSKFDQHVDQGKSPGVSRVAVTGPNAQFMEHEEFDGTFGFIGTPKNDLTDKDPFKTVSAEEVSYESILRRSLSVDNIKISPSIKGNPALFNLAVNGGSPNEFIGTQPICAMTIKYPILQGDKTLGSIFHGSPTRSGLQYDELFSSFYRIVRVSSKFNDGVFVQVLDLVMATPASLASTNLTSTYYTVAIHSSELDDSQSKSDSDTTHIIEDKC